MGLNRIGHAIFLAAVLCPLTLLSAEPKNQLSKYVAAQIAEFDKIPAARREQLQKLANYATSQFDQKRPIRLTFICTHNSRRSQMAQIWAAIAAEHYRIPNVETFSGGTEKTAFNPRAVAALERAGVPIKKADNKNTENSRYEVLLAERNDTLVCFSKVYNQPPNPKDSFAAVMTCSEADKNCPIVSGASQRIALPYDDPKASDGTAGESKVYDERCAQIAREMLFVFSQLSGQN